jgi:hypothetical protein
VRQAPRGAAGCDQCNRAAQPVRCSKAPFSRRFLAFLCRSRNCSRRAQPAAVLCSDFANDVTVANSFLPRIFGGVNVGDTPRPSSVELNHRFLASPNKVAGLGLHNRDASRT